MKSRLAEEVSVAENLSRTQSGFKVGRPTGDIIMEILDAVHRTETHSRVLFAILDVRDVFDSIRWADMLDTLANSFHF